MSNLCWSTSLKSRIIKNNLWKTFFHRSRASIRQRSGLASLCSISGLRIWHTLWSGQVWSKALSNSRTLSSRVLVLQTRSSHSSSPFAHEAAPVPLLPPTPPWGCVNKSSWRHWVKLWTDSGSLSSLLTLEECWSPWWWYTAWNLKEFLFLSHISDKYYW